MKLQPEDKKILECLKEKDLVRGIALWPFHWKSNTRSRPAVVWIHRGYGYLGASNPHQGITNVGFASWIFKRLMVVPARKTAVLEEPPIFSFDTSFLWLACRNYSAMLLGYAYSGGMGSMAQPVASAWPVARSPQLWEGLLLGRDLSSSPYLPARSCSRLPYIRMRD